MNRVNTFNHLSLCRSPICFLSFHLSFLCSVKSSWWPLSLATSVDSPSAIVRKSKEKKERKALKPTFKDGDVLPDL